MSFRFSYNNCVNCNNLGTSNNIIEKQLFFKHLEKYWVFRPMRHNKPVLALETKLTLQVVSAGMLQHFGSVVIR